MIATDAGCAHASAHGNRRSIEHATSRRSAVTPLSYAKKNPYVDIAIQWGFIL
jgi:hypothetical protein